MEDSSKEGICHVADVAGALCARDCKGADSIYVETGRAVKTGRYTVRRLTPTECERLQGFPDGHTRISYKGKPAEDCPDTPRYKALGNSMAVPVIAWIGRRIDRAFQE